MSRVAGAEARLGQVVGAALPPCTDPLPASIRPGQSATWKGRKGSVQEKPGSEGFVSSLEYLARSSTAVLVGKVTDISCHISVDGNEILTLSTISVTNLLKGGSSVGREVFLITRGGRLVQASYWQEHRIQGIDPLRLGSSYVFFMNAARRRVKNFPDKMSQSDPYGLVAEGYGAIELLPSGTVQSTFRNRSNRANVAGRYQGVAVTVFLEEVRASITEAGASQRLWRNDDPSRAHVGVFNDGCDAVRPVVSQPCESCGR